jgi:hypothetical protein
MKRKHPHPVVPRRKVFGVTPTHTHCTLASVVGLLMHYFGHPWVVYGLTLLLIAEVLRWHIEA